MRCPTEMATKFNIFNLTSRELDEVVSTWGWPKFRADQLRDWVYKKLVFDPNQMTNLGMVERATLSQSRDLFTATSAREQRSSDGTIKLLLDWSGANAETVMIPDGDRRTACVSSQVGCPVGCTFCAS